ncbi:hypothetical protein [Candidatus Electronema sp. PJ]|uniref:hypothetical protein n=1 Tax=Candidatus Electronema sp. PJ TaxID=3401572 RepID=UPI003AA94805
MQTQTTLTVLSAALLLSASAASALEIKSGNDKVQVQLYGEIDRAVMYADDGYQDKFFHVDNTNSETRIGLNGELSGDNDNLTIGSSLELKWQANPSHAVSMEEESIAGEFSEELVEVYFDFKNAGKFSIGQGSMASDGASEIDLSGTDIVGNSGVADIGGGLTFYDTAGGGYGGESGGTLVGEAFKRQCCDLFNRITSDGLGKRQRVRYDTPTFAGFSLGAATGAEDTADLALNYSGEFSGHQLQAIAAWSNPGKGGDYAQINASASLLLSSGFNFTVGFGFHDMDNLPNDSDDPVFTYGKIGYKCDQLSSLGSTAISVDYGIYKNGTALNIEQEATALGVQFVQELSAYSTELFAGYRTFALEDNTNADYEDISIIMAGARLSF